MSTYIYDYQTGSRVAPISDCTDGLCAALQDAAGESEEATVVARRGTDGAWGYVRPSEREAGDLVVYCE
jgi:hypothetical protein